MRADKHLYVNKLLIIMTNIAKVLLYAPKYGII